MNETQTQQPRIDWPRASRNVALGLWGAGTYIGLLAGIAWLAATAGDPNPQMAATLAVIGSTLANLIVFAAVECGYRN